MPPVKNADKILETLVHRLVEADTIKHVANVLVECTRELFEWDAFIFSERMEGSTQFLRVMAWDIIDNKLQEVDPARFPPTPYHSQLELHRGESLLVNKKPEAPMMNAFGNSARKSACLLFAPIHYHGKLQGVVSIQSYTPNRYDQGDLDLLGLIAGTVAPAMRRALAERELERQVEKLEEANREINRQAAIQHAIFNIARSARKVRTLEELYPLVHEGIRSVVDVENLFIGLYNIEKGTIRYPYAVDEVDDYTNVEAPLEKTLSNIVLIRREPLLIDEKGYQRLVEEKLVVTQGTPPKSWLGVPLQSGDKTIGLVAVQSYERPNAFDTSDMEILQFVCSEIAGIIDYTWLVDEIRVNEGRYRSAIIQAGAVPYQREFGVEEWTYLGEGIKDLVGYPATEFSPKLLRSMILKVVMHGECEGESFDASLERSRTGQLNEWRSDYLIRRRDGKERWLSDSSVLFHDDDGKLVGTIGILQDITEVVEAKRLNEGSVLLARALGGARSVGEVAQSIADVFDKVFGWDAFYLTLYDPTTRLCQSILEYDELDGKRVESLVTTQKKRIPSTTFRRVLEDGPLLISDALENDIIPRKRFGNKSRKSASVLYAPIKHVDGTPLAMVSLQSYTPKHYTQRDLDLLVVFAGRCAGALYRTVAEEKIRRAHERTELLAAVGRDLSHAATAEEAGLIIVEAVNSLQIPWDACFLDLYNPETGKIREIMSMDTVEGQRVELQGEKFEEGPGPSEKRTLKEGAFIINRKSPDDTDEALRKFGSKRRSQSLMFAPARHAGNVVGFLSFQSYTRGEYDQQSLDLLQMLADHCAGALERIRLVQAIRLSEERYALASRGSNDGLWDWDLVRKKIHLSDRWKGILGYTPEEIGDDPDEWLKRIDPEDLAPVREALRAHFDKEIPHFESEHRLVAKDSTQVWVLCRGICVHDNDGRAIRIVGSMTDISLRKFQEAQLINSAFHDPLTGLANRALFLDRLDQCLERAKRNRKYRFGVMYMDLDKFKAVNDTHGHTMGDKLLHAVGQRLQRHFRSGDTIARLGGDEFTVVLDELKHRRNITTIADRVLKDLLTPFQISGKSLEIGVSIGIATSDTKYDTVEEILHDADTALYRAKELGKARYELFDVAMREAIQRTDQTEESLRHALKEGEFVLHYQPIFDLKGNNLVGMEALLRWNKPGVGLIPPQDFLAVAEESGLIVPIGEWVVAEAVKQRETWGGKFPNQCVDHFVSINLSPSQFGAASTAAALEKALRETGLAGNLVHIEITEASLLGDMVRVQAAFRRWKKLGVKVALDDFGTGYSSLSYLHNFPLDALKIDRSFINRMGNDPSSQYIVRAVIGIASILHLKVVAEGGESREQLEILKEMECGFAQGFFLSPGLPPEEMEKYFTTVEKTGTD